MNVAVDGECDAAFRGVREVFEASFADGQNVGAAVCVFLDGRPVVDLWAGTADLRTSRAWRRDTPCLTFSCTKAVTAVGALLVAEQEGLPVDTPVIEWWPEFGIHQKDATTLEHFLTHTAGLPAFVEPIQPEDAADPAAMAALLATQAPEWEPGSAHGYHALTFGWLVGEFVRRRRGVSVGEFVRRSFGPQLHIGATAAVLERVARTTIARTEGSEFSNGASDAISRLAAAYRDPASLMSRSSTNPPVRANTATFLKGGWPGGGLIATARELAAFYRDLVAGRILAPQTLQDAIRQRVDGPDRVLLLDSAFGLGFMRASTTMPLPTAARPGAFGHPGNGGALGLGDLDARLAFAFVPNLRRTAGDLRARDLVRATYASL